MKKTIIILIILSALAPFQIASAQAKQKPIKKPVDYKLELSRRGVFVENPYQFGDIYYYYIWRDLNDESGFKNLTIALEDKPFRLKHDCYSLLLAAGCYSRQYRKIFAAVNSGYSFDRVLIHEYVHSAGVPATPEEHHHADDYAFWKMKKLGIK